MRAAICLAVALLVALAAADLEGQPQSQPMNLAGLQANGFCSGQSCSTEGTLPGSQNERELFAIFNTARSDPAWWKANNAVLNVPSIMSKYTAQRTLQWSYSAAAASNFHVANLARFSPASCLPSMGDCGNTAPQAGCFPNAINNSTGTYCCFRVSDCQDNQIGNSERLIQFGLPWSSQRFPISGKLQDGRSYGAQAAFIAADTGSAYATVTSFLCDADEDNNCKPDCDANEFNDCENAEQASGRLQIYYPFHHVGGAGVTSCGTCEFSTYWAMAIAFYAVEAFYPTYPVASGSFVSTFGSKGSGFVLSYWNEKVSANPTGVYVLVEGATSLQAMPKLATGQSYFQPATLTACTNYAFFVYEGGTVFPYPATGSFQAGPGCTTTWTSAQVGRSCDVNIPSCATNGVCIDANTCTCLKGTFEDGACKGAASALVASLLLLAACVAALL